MLKKLDRYRYVNPTSYRQGMRVEGLIYASEQLISHIEKDQTIDQVANVATLPGLVGRSLAMPDAHQGYGFCIGGVAAVDMDEGVVSAGGVGFDINCGVPLLDAAITPSEIPPHAEALPHHHISNIPLGARNRRPLH